MARAKGQKKTTVTNVKHKDKRKNIPTEELRDFLPVKDAEGRPLRYLRDASLDPQLVWTGKDAENGEPLSVESAPIYIQEKIHPRAIIEDLIAHAGESTSDAQPSLFRDFNGIDFEELVDFYKHEQSWTNRMILGDSLEAMASLADREALRGKVQAIYIDPPYGIEFGSNWQVSTQNRDLRDGNEADLTRQPEQIRAYRDTWKLGIHSYLSYLRDRLVVARDLLTPTGSVFVQIGDTNVHLVRCLLDEIFGRENAVNTIVFYKTSSEATSALPNVADYILWYAKDAEQAKTRPLYRRKKPGRVGAKQYVYKANDSGDIERLSKEELANPSLVPDGWRICRRGYPLTSQHYSPTRTVPFEFKGKTYHPGKNRQWSLDPKNEMKALVEKGRVYATKNSINGIFYLEDKPVTELHNVWIDTGTGSFTRTQIYVVQTSEKVVERCLLMATDPGDLVLDPTCGSGTTAFAAEKWGRRWITIDTSRVALALARSRLMAAKYPYFELADTPEGRRKEAEITGNPPPEDLGPTGGDIKKGFVYNRAPDRALSDIARGTLGDAKLLYDDPVEDSKKVRVTGPFTVESLSPHRTLAVDPDRPRSEEEAEAEKSGGQFELMIIDHLRKAGVQNTRKDERLEFESLEPYAGEWIQATGEYLDRDGERRRVAVCIGPEKGTLGPLHVKEAAKEAVQGLGFDLLLVCGFALDPHVAEEVKRYGELRILPVRMNPDLVMGQGLLKNTGTGNLFMVFGDPDVEITQKDGEVVVELRGLDIYDPTTGRVRSSSTDKIAAWFIDTAYNDESFFVRQAYFTGGDDPYGDLQKALKADVNKEAWEQLYSTTSMPFEVPGTSKIAVKVINDYGDEVLKVYDLSAT